MILNLMTWEVLLNSICGKVTNLFGEEQRYDTDINGAVISNGKVHDEVIEVIKNKLK